MLKNISVLKKELAQRIKQRRLEKNWTQREFAERSGIGYDTYRRFEGSGDITLHNLILCAILLDEQENIERLFSTRHYESLDEILTQTKTKKRQRASGTG